MSQKRIITHQLVRILALTLGGLHMAIGLAGIIIVSIVRFLVKEIELIRAARDLVDLIHGIIVSYYPFMIAIGLASVILGILYKKLWKQNTILFSSLAFVMLVYCFFYIMAIVNQVLPVVSGKLPDNEYVTYLMVFFRGYFLVILSFILILPYVCIAVFSLALKKRNSKFAKVLEKNV